ncbi:MAG: hypothetical protein P1U68_08105 [Verrucomicrobiales bacterium]|nr:hypothetical protein [Verrucomicrobiales bacterium]
MKTILITLAVVATALIGFTPQAEAGTKKEILRFVGHQFSKKNHHGHGHGHGHRAPYVVRTSEVCRSYQTRHGYRPCGSIYYYKVTTVTYRDYYSNGSSRTYTRTLS